MVKLEAIGNTTGNEYNPHITAVGTAGEYVVTFTDNNSIFVQKFNANGTVRGSMVQLEAIGNTTGSYYQPQITAVGTAGAYVVTFAGMDSAGGHSICVQKFNANGTKAGSMVQLEAIGNTTGSYYQPQITAVGTAGAYVVTFYGVDSAGDLSIFVQKFNANGTLSGSMVQLEAIANTTGYDFVPQITAVGTAGEYVVTFQGVDSAGDYSIFVQKFNANGTISGSMVQLEAIGNTTGTDNDPKITAVGTAGEYVVTFQGQEGTADDSIFVQKFNPNGTKAGSIVQLEAIGNTTGYDRAPQITAVGTAGEYVVTFQGVDSAGDYSIFVQKFNVNGTVSGPMVQLEGINQTRGYDNMPQVTAVGTAGEYVVTFSGVGGSTVDYSIFVQKFNANGTVSGSMVKLEAIGNTTGSDTDPEVTAVGTTGEYVVTFKGMDGTGNTGDQSIFVQKFNADGTIPTAAQDHLATYRVTIQQAQTFIVEHLATPSTIYNTCFEYHVTNQMIVEIFDNTYSIDIVKDFFSAAGLNPASLDLFA